MPEAPHSSIGPRPGFLRTLVAAALLLPPAGLVTGRTASASADVFSGPPGSIVTIAGGRHGDALPGPEASVVPRGVAVGPDGLLYVSDEGHSRIRRVAADGTVEPFAGHLTGFGGDGGQARDASLHRPSGLDFDEAGNLYVADTVNDRVRKITPQGVITTVAGDGTRSFGGDGGPATSAQLSRPTDVAVDRDGNVFIADLENSRVRRVDADTGVITTYAGGPLRTVNVAGVGPDIHGGSFKADQVAVTPSALAIGQDDDLYITDSCSVRRIDSESQAITTVVGGGCGYSGDGGPASAAKLGRGNFSGPFGLDITPDGRIWIADSDNYVVRMIDTNGIIRTVAGNGESHGHLGDGGSALNATLQYPMATAVDQAGNLYVATSSILDGDTSDGNEHERVRVVRPDGTIDTHVGNGTWHPTPASGRPGIGAGFGPVNGLVWDSQNRLYIAASGTDNQSGGSLWRLDPDGLLHRVAGNGKVETLDTGDETGDALSVPVSPEGLDIGPDGRLYFGDAASWQVKVYDPQTQTIDVVAGKKVVEPYRTPVPMSEPAAEAELVEPYGVTVGGDGTVYFTEGDHYNWVDIGVDMGRLRAVRDGRVELVAGLPGGKKSAGFNGDDLPARQAMMRAPWGLDALAGGDLLVSEVENRRVRHYDAETGKLTTLAGDGAEDSRVGALGEFSSLKYPRDVEPDGQGGFFVADGECCVANIGRPGLTTHIVHVAASGMSSYVAGSGTVAEGRDGPALEESLHDPSALALGSRGLAFADRDRVRLLIPPQGGWPSPPPQEVCHPNATDVSGDSHGTIGVVDTPNNPSFDVLGTDVRTIGQDFEVTLQLDDIDPVTMWRPQDDEGQMPAWVYQIWTGLPRGASEVKATKVVYLGAFAAASIDDPNGADPDGFVFEVGAYTGGVGFDEEGREQAMTVKRLGPATGAVDLVNDTVRIRAPLSSLGLNAGDFSYRQYGIAGQITQVTNGFSNFRYLTYYDTTPLQSRHRTVVFGRNCSDA